MVGIMIFKKINLLLISALFVQNSYATDTARIETSTTVHTVTLKTWKSLRDYRVVKQNKDYSCGAASIATLLTEYYHRPTSEKEVLTLLTKVANKEGRTSFSDMKRILPDLGFRGLGIATSWEQLIKLKIPVIVYVRHRKQDHFTVISGISGKKVRLSDPSLGNRIFTRGQFKKIWETREKGLKGKMLAILPLTRENKKKFDPTFFLKPENEYLTKDQLFLKHGVFR